jgi:ABC-2 type transport system permease protein
MNQIWAIAVKELRQLVRDKAGAFWVLGFPILMSLFFGFMMSGDGERPPISVALALEDSSAAARALAARLDTTRALSVRRHTAADAQALVRRGRLVAYVRIPSGYGPVGVVAMPRVESVEIGIDPARRAEAGAIGGAIAQAAYAPMIEMMSPTSGEDGGGGERGMPRIVAVTDDEAVEPRSAFEITFPSGILWGLLGTAATFGVSIVVERRRGTYARLRLAPVSRRTILAGKGLACFLACIGVTAVLLTAGALAFHVRIANPLWIVLAGVCVSLCFTGLMMAMTVLGKTEQGVSGAGWAIFLIFSMLGGGMIPLAFMPGWMQSVSNVSPVKWGILALEGAIWRDFSLAQILAPSAVLLGVGAAAFALGAWRMRRMDAAA